MLNRPYTFTIDLPAGRPSNFHLHTKRYLRDMSGQFWDETAFQTLFAELGNIPLYEVYELTRPAVPGELIHGISILHSGIVGNEYFMTKGHYHVVLETSELYHCLSGQGVMVMENLDGEWEILELRPGVSLYVLPGWAHRSVNTSPTEDLISLFAYPGNAGHDYGTIETQGFRKLVINRSGSPAVINNPRWLAPTERL